MSESFDKAVEAAHAAICEESLSDCLDLDWGGGKCYRAVRAALPHLTARDVPHVAREAWGKGWNRAVDAHSSEWRDPKYSRNPYAEEADYE